jgi:EAL domain-containing protein (putative c-di-GMP-specific phosphodiesterase class I)
MAFQPIVSWRQKAVHAYEALVRTAEVTLARPEHFFHAAEQLHRVQELGRTIRHSVAQAMAFAPRDALVFVNLHATDFADDDLFARSSALEVDETLRFSIGDRAVTG